MNVWEQNFWAAGFWADDFWGTPEVVPEVPPVYIPQMNAFGGHPIRDWVQIPKRKVRRNRRDEILFLTH